MAFRYWNERAALTPLISANAALLAGEVRWDAALAPPVVEAHYNGDLQIAGDAWDASDTVSVQVALPIQNDQYVWKLTHAALLMSAKNNGSDTNYSQTYFPDSIFFSSNMPLTDDGLESDGPNFMETASQWNAALISGTNRQTSSRIYGKVGRFGDPVPLLPGDSHLATILEYLPGQAIETYGFQLRGGVMWAWSPRIDTPVSSNLAVWPRCRWIGWPVAMRRNAALRLPELFHI